MLADLNNRQFVKAYANLVHHPLELEGVDFWWIDWQQGKARSRTEIDPLWTLNALHALEEQQEKGEEALSFRRYAGPGRDRYPIGLLGELIASWQSLKC